MIQRIQPKADFIAMEHEILDFWQKNNIFQKRELPERVGTRGVVL